MTNISRTQKFHELAIGAVFYDVSSYCYTKSIPTETSNAVSQDGLPVKIHPNATVKSSMEHSRAFPNEAALERGINCALKYCSLFDKGFKEDPCV